VRELIFEVLLRGIKPLLALVIGLVAFAVAIGLAGAVPSAELAILCFLFGGMIVLLAQEGPI